MTETTCTNCGAPRMSFEAICAMCLHGAPVEDQVDAPDDDAPSDGVPGLIDWNAERKRRGMAPIMIEPPPGASLLPSPDTAITARPCEHQQVMVDGKEREITCQACDAVLDPIWVLMRYALKERDFLRYRQYEIDEQKKIRAETEQLKKERQKARNGVNRDPLVKRIHALEKALQTAQTVAYEYKSCYLGAKTKLEEQGKKPPRKPHPGIVGGLE